MAHDRGLEGPADPGAIDVPDGLTPLEVRAGEEARRHMIEHLGNRPVLNMDQLAEMVDARPRLEKEIKLRGDSRSKNKVYFFSIDGTIRGNSFRGCLFAGECMIVQAPSFEKALRQAKDGLDSTLELAREYFEEANRSVLVTSPLEASHMNIDVGGRRGHLLDQPDLKSDPKLKAMIQHIIGKKPWSG